MQYIVYSMFITMPAGLQDGIPDRVIFKWG